MSARTASIPEAVATVQAQLGVALAALPGGGDAAVRDALLVYLCSRQAQRMVAEIFGDATAETPADVADPLRERMVLELASRVRGAVSP